ncbi:ATP-dependent nuclease [Alteromonas sp. PRIM-21]|uniref:ATP-dependent nuclease n=1 Tax=Alteromonas sp. PRIM-21 TaxID=1454978 RepID=UPI0022B9A611|nr:AAA family ATPase [Alteromonas sp. PRIM-21]MCZ8530025.1 AAA family ATPase [Alteromonas sp. PRIM-21]
MSEHVQKDEVCTVVTSKNKSVFIESIYFTNIRGSDNCHGQDEAGYERSYGDFIEFRKVNILIGENGSGKSTILDIINALSQPDLLASLPKDNLKKNEKIKLNINLLIDDNKHELRYRYSPVFGGLKKKEFQLYFNINGSDFNGLGYTLFDSYRKRRLTTIYRSLFQKGVNHANIFSFNNRGNNLETVIEDYQTNFDEYFLLELNNAYRHFHGVTSFREMDGNKCFGRDQNGYFSQVLLSDPVMFNRVAEKYMPSGWRQYGEITSFLQCLPSNSICTIDEPEVHLHPNLQRLLILRIKAIAQAKNIQLFIGTHSPVIINNLDYENGKLFHARINSIDEVKPSKAILDGLGYKLSDYLQTDGVVWVEGPSDKIYLLEWLRAYAKANRDESYNFELLNFEFLFYGGSTLSHFGKDEELIDFLSINQNSAVIMDNDNDYDHNKEVFIQDNKKRVFDEYNSHPNSACWVTHEYTIESYLPDSFRERFFEVKNNRLLKDSGYSKTKIASLSKEEVDSEMLLKNRTELNTFLGELLSLIEKWNGVEV